MAAEGTGSTSGYFGDQTTSESKKPRFSFRVPGSTVAKLPVALACH
jgi:hypothetical protein